MRHPGLLTDATDASNTPPPLTSSVSSLEQTSVRISAGTVRLTSCGVATGGIMEQCEFKTLRPATQQLLRDAVRCASDMEAAVAHDKLCYVNTLPDLVMALARKLVENDNSN
jgi:cob(I)alamin adenosyltransferase